MPCTDDFFSQIKRLDRMTNEGDGNPKKEIQLLRASPFLQIVLPAAPYDFNAGRTKGILSLLRKFGRASGAIGRIYEGHINALFLLHLYGTEEQKQLYYKKVTDERVILGVWNTDAPDPIAFRHTGTKVTIRGSKAFCSGAGFVNHAIIGGKWEGREGWQLIIVPMEQVPADRIDRSSWKTLGMKSSTSFTIDFASIAVPENCLLGFIDDYTRPPFFLGGAIRFAAVHQGMAEAIMTATLQYLIQRNRAEHVFQKMRIGQMEMAIRTGQLWLKDAADLFDKTLDNPEQYGDRLVSYANMTRLVIEKIGLYIIELSAKSIGALGLFSDIGIEQLHRDLAFYLRQPAPDETLQNAATFIIDAAEDILDMYDPDCG